MRLFQRNGTEPATTSERAAPPAVVPPPAAAGAPGEEAPRADRPGFRERAALRRRLTFLRRRRELALRDLGGLALDLHRFGGRREVLDERAAALAALDDELQGLEARLGDRRPVTVVRAPGIGGACRHCGAYLGTDARFCATCGEPVRDAPGLAAPERAALPAPPVPASPSPPPAAPPAPSLEKVPAATAPSPDRPPAPPAPAPAPVNGTGPDAPTGVLPSTPPSDLSRLAGGDPLAQPVATPASPAVVPLNAGDPLEQPAPPAPDPGNAPLSPGDPLDPAAGDDPAVLPPR